jgi:predicted GNAT family N-acyltransferase
VRLSESSGGAKVSTGRRGGPDVRVEQAGDDLLRAAQALRRAVFVFEQGVPIADEVDERDHEALHLVALVRDRVVATVRLFDEGRRWRLTRMAVDRRHRSRGLGKALVDDAHRRARASGASEMILSAQISARDFYLRQGYESFGEPYLDAGIPHVGMRRALDDV